MSDNIGGKRPEDKRRHVKDRGEKDRKISEKAKEKVRKSK